MDSKQIQQIVKEENGHLQKEFGDFKNEIKEGLKQQTKELREESQRHQKMLLEEFDSRLRPIAEMQIEHSKKFDALFEMVAKNTEDIDLIKGMFRHTVDIREHEALERRVTLIEKKLRNA